MSARLWGATGMGGQSNIVPHRSSEATGRSAARARSQGSQAEVKLYDFVTLRQGSAASAVSTAAATPSAGATRIAMPSLRTAREARRANGRNGARALRRIQRVRKALLDARMIVPSGRESAIAAAISILLKLERYEQRAYARKMKFLRLML